MDKFDRITGSVGDNNYTECHSQTINVNKLTDAEIDTLETMGYQKYFGYEKGNFWCSATLNENGRIDPKKIEKKIKKGYILKKEMFKVSNIPINQCQWIDDIVIDDEKCGYKKMTFYFPYDRYCDLELQKKILEQNTFITYRDILQFVDAFYDGYLTRDELKLVKDTTDVFGYSKLAKEAYDNDLSVKRKSVMGDKKRFEGFPRKRDDGYEIYLGS